MVNQPLKAHELITYANQILARHITMDTSGMYDVQDLAMGKEHQWLGLAPGCSYTDILKKAQDIVADKHILALSIIENQNNKTRITL